MNDLSPASTPAPPPTLLTVSPDLLRIRMALFPDVVGIYLDVMQNKRRFVHYTGAGAGISIIRNRRVWMRKPQWMNDWSEVEHGLDCLKYMYNAGDGGKKFKAALGNVSPGMLERVEKNFNVWIENYRSNTFVACVALHEDHEDNTGRMGMWTGHCKVDGVALVLKQDPFVALADTLGAYSFPVFYETKEGIDGMYARTAAAIEREAEFIKSIEPAVVEGMLHEMFKYTMVCTKHATFKDEREWRIVYSPDRDQLKPRVMQKSVEMINGAPQPIYNIPLDKHGGYDISVPAILDRVIVGPTRFPSAVVEAFIDELEAAGVAEARKKVWYTDIPLRP